MEAVEKEKTNLVVRTELNSCVYLVGESLFCKISIKNTKRESEQKGETVSWASVQLLGKLNVDTSWINLPSTAKHKPARKKPPIKKTTSLLHVDEALGKNSRCIFSTRAHILVCDLTLKPMESKTYVFRCPLPTDLPPSFHGRAFRLSYWLAVTAQRPKGMAVSKRISFRIANPVVFNKINLLSWDKREIHQASSFEKKPVSEAQYSPSPFMLLKRDPELSLTAAWRQRAYTESKEKNIDKSQFSPEEEHTEVMSKHELGLSIRSINLLYNQLAEPKSYNITRGRDDKLGFICKVSIKKNGYRLGETIKGVISFENADIPCYQTSVFLQSIEEIDKNLLNKNRHNHRIRKLHAEHHEYTLNARLVHFIFTLPTTEAQEFESDIASMKWVLHFEFVISPNFSFSLHNPSSNPDNIDSSDPSFIQPEDETDGLVPLQKQNSNKNTQTLMESLGTDVVDVDLLPWDLPFKVLVPCVPPEPIGCQKSFQFSF